MNKQILSWLLVGLFAGISSGCSSGSSTSGGSFSPPPPVGETANGGPSPTQGTSAGQGGASGSASSPGAASSPSVPIAYTQPSSGGSYYTSSSSAAKGGSTSSNPFTVVGTSTGTAPTGGSTMVVLTSTGVQTSTAPVAVAKVNPFVVAAHDPFSTFGADVDTASYDIFRQYALKNQLPPSTGVRLEEYVNYFAYDYPAPPATGPHPFQISVAAAAQVFDRPTTLVRVGIQATKPAPFTKKPTNLVFLLDVSGSMADTNKLPLIQTMMVDALDILAPADTVAVVTYSTTATVQLKPTAVSQRQAIEKVINALVASGSTAGADGMGLAYQQAAAGFIEGGINHIVMCTDGDFNVGPSSTTELLNLIRSKRQTGVTLTTLGFGTGNLNDSMMEAISDAGNGIYSVIIDADHAKQYVRDKLLSTVVHVAKDMKIPDEFNPEVVYAYRLLGYEDRDIADANFRNDAIDAGEVGAGHRVTALYELVLAGGKIPSATGAPALDEGATSTLAREILPGDAVLVKVRYKTVDATDATPALEVSASLGSTALDTSLEVADQDLRWASAVAGLAELLKKSPYAQKSFLPSIRSICAAQATRDADRTEFTALLEKIVPLL
jgi:Ca-activated chloride channel family protein